MKLSRLTSCFVVALLLAVFPIAVDRMRYIPILSEAGELLWLPGAAMASIVYPAGVHTGGGTNAYFPLTVVMNFALYFGLFYLFLRYLSSGKKAVTRT